MYVLRHRHPVVHGWPLVRARSPRQALQPARASTHPRCLHIRQVRGHHIWYIRPPSPLRVLEWNPHGVRDRDDVRQHHLFILVLPPRGCHPPRLPESRIILRVLRASRYVFISLLVPRPISDRHDLQKEHHILCGSRSFPPSAVSGSKSTSTQTTTFLCAVATSATSSTFTSISSPPPAPSPSSPGLTSTSSAVSAHPRPFATVQSGHPRGACWARPSSRYQPSRRSLSCWLIYLRRKGAR